MKRAERLPVLLGSFLRRVVYAALLGMIGWATAMLPFGEWEHPAMRTLAFILDYPVALVSRLLPGPLKAVDLFFDHYEWAGVPAGQALLRHVRVAVPVYLFLLYLPTLVLNGWRALRRRADSPP